MNLRTLLGQGGRRLTFLLPFLLFSAFGCSSPQPVVSGPSGHPFVEADRLFHQDPRWLGADAALSIPLSANRTLWLFGDTFVAQSSANVRRDSRMVRNTVAIQTGSDPRTASMSFSWGKAADGSPASFFPDHNQQWHWPGHGIRLPEGPLVVFLFNMVSTPGENLGFACTGYSLAVVDDPDEPATTWNVRVFPVAASSFDAVPATAVVRDGAHVVALAIRQRGIHAGALVRYPAAALAKGDTTGAEWWSGNDRGWVAASALDADGPDFVMDDAGAEASLHWSESAQSFIHVASYGFGASTIGLRTAPALTGPWSAPVAIYRPPESDGTHPFVYAAKAHPELVGPNAADVVITYASNSFQFSDLLTQSGTRSLYWPRFVIVPIGN